MKFTPLRISLIYLGFAIVWVTVTDWMVESLFEGEELITRVQMIKGVCYVSVTAFFIYWMVKSHERTLKRGQELQNKILSNIPVMITVYRPDLSKFSVNKEFEKITGWKNRDVQSVNIMDKIYPDKEYQKSLREFMKNPDGSWKDVEMVTRDGEKVKSTWTNVRLSDDTQIGIGLDITKRKEIEEELKKNQEWLHLTTTSSNVGLWEWHPQTGKTVFDEVWANLMGYTLESLQPISIEGWYDLIHPEDMVKLQPKIEQYFSGEKQIFECEVRMKHKQGHWVWILARGRAVEWDEEGNPERIVGTSVDINQQKNIEKRISAERQRFEIASNLTSDVIWEWKPDMNELWWGDGIESVLGYTKKEYKNNPDFWKNRIAEHDRRRVYKSMMKAESSGATQWFEEYDFIAADGSIRKIKDNAVILRNDDGSVRRIIGAMVDRTKEIEYQEALHHQSHRFEMIAKSSNDVLYEWDLGSNNVWWSEGWQSRFYYHKNDISQTFKWWEEKIHPDDRKKTLNNLNETAHSNNEKWTAYYRFKNGKGTYSHVVDNGFFMKNSEGENEYMVGTISDITADVVAKEELKASEEQYRLLFKQNPIPMFIYDPNTLKFSTVNEAALDKYGYEEKEMIGLSIKEIRPKSEIEYLKKVINEYSDDDRSNFHEAIHKTKDGEKLIVEISSSAIFYKGKKQRLVIANDITEQRRAEEKAISAIIEGEERERQRIAKELHDGLGQYLSASNMNLKSVYEDLENIPESLDSTFETGLNLLKHAISETRNISQNLMPKAIQDYGLELAAESLTNHLRNSQNIDVYFYSNLDSVELPNKIQINLYRILQEALNNAIKHGEPGKIEVQLTYSEGEILLTIEDNGKGFDTLKTNGDGIGIRSIKTRVGAMSANLDIVSKKGRGTIISVVVPIY